MVATGALGYCLLLGNERSRDRALLGAARASRRPVAVVQANGRINKSRFADITLSADSKDPVATLKAVHAHEARTGALPMSVIPLTEMTLETGLVIAKHFDLPYLAESAVFKARDKHAMRQAFQTHDLAVPRFFPFYTFEELEAQALKIGFPVVIKPRNAGASEGVRFIRERTELAPGYEELVQVSRRNNAIYGTQYGLFQVEEYIDAPYEVSVEVLSNGSRREALAVTDKILGARPYFVEMGHSVPSIWSHDADVTRVALRACEALGIDRGLSHVELKVRPNQQPVLMEVNARPGGDSILDLAEKVTGVNFFELHCATYLGSAFPLESKLPVSGRAAIAFMKAGPGKITRVSLPAEDSLPDHVVSVQLWARPGTASARCVDSNTRDGSVEFYWPHDAASSPLLEHVDFARQLAQQCIEIGPL